MGQSPCRSTASSGRSSHLPSAPRKRRPQLSIHHIHKTDTCRRAWKPGLSTLTTHIAMDSPSVWTSIQNEPLLPPPHGVTPNLEHPESRADDIFITAGICLALILLSAAVRLYAKVTALRKWTWDDCEALFLLWRSKLISAPVTFLLGLVLTLIYTERAFVWLVCY